MSKTCKICGKKRYANINLCYSCYRKREKEKREEKAKKKLEKKKTTKKYQKEIVDKLMKKCDKLYQEIGRKMYDKSFFGDEYNCLHHIVRKSQGLNTRYDFENGMPVSLSEHCSIHKAQDCNFEGTYILYKGEKWFNELQKRRRIIITDRLSFLKEKYEELKNILKEYE
jgi:hypothetical protein